MAAPLLAQALGGGRTACWRLAFVAAVAFATIVAVVAGLVLASHLGDRARSLQGVAAGRASTGEQVRAGHVPPCLRRAVDRAQHLRPRAERRPSGCAGLLGRRIGKFPRIVMTLFWRRCNTGGIVACMVVGTLSAIGLVLVSPNMTYPLCVTAAARRCSMKRRPSWR